MGKLDQLKEKMESYLNVPFLDQDMVIYLRGKDGKLQFFEDNLARILEPVSDLPISILSVAGAKRTGKSFLLNQIVSTLEQIALNKESTSTSVPNKAEKKLKGFSWAPGRESVTRGILMWKKAFILEAGNNKKVAVVLMDTQGAFDRESNQSDVTSLFSLSMLLSSVQVYNILGNFDESHLSHLKTAVEYGLAMKKAGANDSFQSLCFLLRDWRNGEYDFGSEGGKKFITDELQSGQEYSSDSKAVREYLRQHLDHVDGFLMPLAPMNMSKKTFSGCVEDIHDAAFVEILEQCVNEFIAKSSATVKSIDGEQDMTGNQFMRFCENLYGRFIEESKPAITTLMQINYDFRCAAAVDRATDKFVKLLNAEMQRLAESAASELPQELVERAQAEGAAIYKKQCEGIPNQESVSNHFAKMYSQFTKAEEHGNRTLRLLEQQRNAQEQKLVAEQQRKAQEEQMEEQQMREAEKQKRAEAVNCYNENMVQDCGDEFLPPSEFKGVHDACKRAAKRLYNLGAAPNISVDRNEDELILDQEIEVRKTFYADLNRGRKPTFTSCFISAHQATKTIGITAGFETFFKKFGQWIKY